MSSSLRLVSSAEKVLEGGSVELVCVASMRDEDGMCVPHNITWSRSSLSDRARDPLLLTDNHETFPSMSDHVLRVSQIANSSQYCCQVHTDNMMLEECTTLHVVQPHGMYIHACICMQ